MSRNKFTIFLFKAQLKISTLFMGSMPTSTLFMSMYHILFLYYMAAVLRHETMIVKAALTAIDHNINVEREQAVTKQGVPRFKLETDRGGTKWFTKVVKVPKATNWKDEIVSFVLRVK